MGSTNPTQSAVRPVKPGTRAIPEETLLGRYRVLARRGAGGFGTVCTCWDTRLQRRVAIKRIPLLSTEGPAGISASTAEEALAEARTACLLAHPNIVAVYDFETDGTYAYLVMEYVDGLNLAELLARVEGGVLTHEECAHVLRSVAASLAYAHENGVLHLDIKPTNIMIDRQGTVKLADFGMATLASAAGYGGARGGTVGYMPPEQIQGLLVDERTDAFSLAVVTWQALTGRSPFASATPKGSLDAIIRGPKPPLSKLDPSIAPEAEEALLRALAPAAAERTSSVKELARGVLPELGDGAEGAESLRELVDQSENDDPSPAAKPSDLPAHVRLPWLAPALERAASAACTFFAMHAVLPALPGATDAFVLIGAIASAAACAAWPPVGSAVAGTLAPRGFRRCGHSPGRCARNGARHRRLVSPRPPDRRCRRGMVDLLRPYGPRVNGGRLGPRLPQLACRGRCPRWLRHGPASRCRNGCGGRAPLAARRRSHAGRLLGTGNCRGPEPRAREPSYLGHRGWMRGLGTSRLGHRHAGQRHLGHPRASRGGRLHYLVLASSRQSGI